MVLKCLPRYGLRYKAEIEQHQMWCPVKDTIPLKSVLDPTMWEPQANPSKKWSATKKKSQPFKNVVTKDKNTTVKYSRLEEVRDMTTKLKS